MKILDVFTKCNYNIYVWILNGMKKKRKLNIKKHGIDFINAPAIFDSYTLTIEDNRFEYGEERFITFGILMGRVVVVAHTENGNSIRII